MIYIFSSIKFCRTLARQVARIFKQTIYGIVYGGHIPVISTGWNSAMFP